MSQLATASGQGNWRSTAAPSLASATESRSGHKAAHIAERRRNEAGRDGVRDNDRQQFSTMVDRSDDRSASRSADDNAKIADGPDEKVKANTPAAASDAVSAREAMPKPGRKDAARKEHAARKADDDKVATDAPAKAEAPTPASTSDAALAQRETVESKDAEGVTDAASEPSLASDAATFDLLAALVPVAPPLPGAEAVPQSAEAVLGTVAALAGDPALQSVADPMTPTSDDATLLAVAAAGERTLNVGTKSEEPATLDAKGVAAKAKDAELQVTAPVPTAEEKAAEAKVTAVEGRAAQNPQHNGPIPGFGLRPNAGGEAHGHRVERTGQSVDGIAGVATGGSEAAPASSGAASGGAPASATASTAAKPDAVPQTFAEALKASQGAQPQPVATDLPTSTAATPAETAALIASGVDATSPTAAGRGVHLSQSPLTGQGVPVQAVAVTIATRALGGNTRFDIRLDPPELGRIDVRMTLDREGRVKSKIVVENRETYEMLQRDQRNLERTLQQAGIKAADGSVEFSLKDQSSSGQGQSQQGFGREERNGARNWSGELPADAGAVSDQSATLYASLASARGGVDIRL